MFASRAPSEGGTYLKMAGKYSEKNGVTVEFPDLPYADLLRILVSADCSYALTKYDAIFSSSIIAITMLPIARPIIMTLGIFSFQWRWKDYI